VYNPRPMPLPKSILCKKCTRTYPEGWKLCPYCKFDPLQARRDAESTRMLARRGIKVAPVGKPKEEGRRDRDQRGRRPKPGTARPDRGNERNANRPARPTGDRPPQRERQGQRPPENRRPGSPQRNPPTAPVTVPQPEVSANPNSSLQPEKRGRRRRRGRKPGQGGAPNLENAASQTPVPKPQQQPRPPRPPANPSQPSESKPEQEGQGDSPARKRRRRFRKRRGPGGAPEQGGGPSTPQE